MKGGFSFCGTDIADLGIYYVPPTSNMYVYGQTNVYEHEETFEGHHGGYYYGTTVQPKEFSLRCYFEDSHINQGILDNIQAFFRRGRTGRLIFQNRDWLWYSATVMNIDFSALSNYLNGFITINLKAYYPFARTDAKFLTPSDEMHYTSPVLGELVLNENLFGTDVFVEESYSSKKNTGLMYQERTPTTIFTGVTEDFTFLLYNAGDEYAAVSVEMAGDAGDDGVIVTNNTTQQKCKLLGFDKSQTTDLGLYVASDALNGKTYLTDNHSNGDLKFMYHDYGFITLAPGLPIKRDLEVTKTAGVPRITGDKLFSESDLGKYIYIEEAWHKIVSVSDENAINIDADLTQSGTEAATIVAMNEMSVTVSNGTDLDTIQFVYKNTFR